MNKNIIKVGLVSEEATIKASAPTKLQNITELEASIVNIKTVEDLIKAGISYDEIKKAFDAKMKEFKDAVDAQQVQAKQIKKVLEASVKNIKFKAGQVVEVKQIHKINKETGEVTKKQVHNLPTAMFSYIPAKSNLVIDTKEMISNPEEYKKFLKEVTTYEIDFMALEKAGADEVPYMEKKTPSKITFKKLDEVKKSEMLDKIKKDAEAAAAADATSNEQ